LRPQPSFFSYNGAESVDVRRKIKMQNLNRALVGLSLLSMVALTACGGKKEAEVAIESQKVAVPAAPAIAGANPAALLSAVTDTQAAIKAGDFAKAGKSLEQFSGAWKTVGAMAKTKSPKAYTAVEEALPAVQAAVKNKDAASATAALTKLQTAMAAIK
jgi:hypothetical protein